MNPSPEHSLCMALAADAPLHLNEKPAKPVAIFASAGDCSNADNGNAVETISVMASGVRGGIGDVTCNAMPRKA